MRWARVAWFGLVAVALGLSVWCAMEARLPGDLWLTRRLQDLPRWFEGVAEFVRALTSTWVVVIAGTVLVTLFDFTARRRAWFYFAGMMIALPIVQAVIKNLVDRPRPDASLIERRAGFTSESFPAGHVMSGTAFFILCAWLIAERLPSRQARGVVWVVAALSALLGGVANVYEGVHWPSDVLGGYLWAAVLAMGAWTLARRRQPPSLNP